MTLSNTPMPSVHVHSGFSCSIHAQQAARLDSDADSSVGTQFADHGVFLSAQAAAAGTDPASPSYTVPRFGPS